MRSKKWLLAVLVLTFLAVWSGLVSLEVLGNTPDVRADHCTDCNQYDCVTSSDCPGWCNDGCDPAGYCRDCASCPPWDPFCGPNCDPNDPLCL